MKISVLTPSIRPDGLEVLQKSLERQTFQNFEWLVEIGMPKRGCDLSASLNRMLRRAEGEIIVMVQDYIKIPNHSLEEIDCGIHRRRPTKVPGDALAAEPPCCQNHSGRLR